MIVGFFVSGRFGRVAHNGLGLGDGGAIEEQMFNLAQKFN